MKSQDFPFTAIKGLYSLPLIQVTKNSAMPYLNYEILNIFLCNSYKKKRIFPISPILDEKPVFPVYSN